MYANHPSPIDSAWRSRIPAPQSAPTIEEERAAALAAMAAKASAQAREAIARPFRFEDLNGKPEPASWGPKYSKPSKAAPSVDRFPTNCASGQKYDFDAAKHRAKLRAEFAARANVDKRAWAFGGAKSNSVGLLGLTIEQAYARAMAEKAARLEGKPAAPVTRLNEQPAAKPAKPRARPRKLKAAA